MSLVKHFLVFIVTPAIPHGAFKIKVTLCVTAVFTPVLTKYSESFSLAADLDRRRPHPLAWRLDHLVTNVTPKLEISGQCRAGI